jgi:hypothetical protein
MDTLSQHPPATSPAINRGHQSTPPSHQSLPLSSLPLLDHPIEPHLAGAAPIEGSFPPEPADPLPRLEPPRASPLYQEPLRPRQRRLAPLPRPPAAQDAPRPPTSVASTPSSRRRRRRTTTVRSGSNLTVDVARYRFGVKERLTRRPHPVSWPAAWEALVGPAQSLPPRFGPFCFPAWPNISNLV